MKNRPKYCNAIGCPACGWSYYYPEYYHKGWEIKYAWATAGVAKWWARLGAARLHANSEEDLVKLIDQNRHEGAAPTGLPPIVYCYCGVPIHSPDEFYKGWPIFAERTGYKGAVQWHARRITRWRYEHRYHFPDEKGIHPKARSFKEEVKWCKADTREAMLELIDEIEDQK
jgi:hypothetical protein